MDFFNFLRAAAGRAPKQKIEPEIGRAEPIPVPPPPVLPTAREHAIAFGRTRIMCWCGNWHGQQSP